MASEPASTSPADLELQLCANLDDNAAWEKYSHVLTERGDSRGHLIRLELAAGAGAGSAEMQKLVESDRATWLGAELAKILSLPRPAVGLRLRYGFIDEAVFDVPPNVRKWPPLHEQITMTLSSPAAKFIRRIETKNLEVDTDSDAVLNALASHEFPALQSLSLSTWGNPEFGGADLAAAVSKGAPRLQELSIRLAGPHLGPLRLESLKTLKLNTRELSNTAMVSLGKSALPALEALELSMFQPPSEKVLSPKERPTENQIAAAVKALVTSDRLRRVSVSGTGFASGLIKGLVGTRAPALETLVLRNNRIIPELAAQLAQAVPRFPGLKFVSLEGNPLDGIHDELRQHFGHVDVLLSVPPFDLDLAPPPVIDATTRGRLEQAWQRISESSSEEPLPAGCAESEITQAEKEIGKRFPPEYRASIARHGAEDYVVARSLGWSMDMWRGMQAWEYSGFDPRRWLPIGDFAESDGWLLNVDDERVSKGEIRFYSHEVGLEDLGNPSQSAKDYIAWLEFIAEGKIPL